jgi:hypothetical protein
MSEFGNGVAVAVEALQDDLDLVDVFWCAALEAARPGGVVDAGVRCLGGPGPKSCPGGCRGWPLRPRGFPPRRGAPPACPRGRSPYLPIAPPAFSAG